MAHPGHDHRYPQYWETLLEVLEQPADRAPDQQGADHDQQQGVVSGGEKD